MARPDCPFGLYGDKRGDDDDENPDEEVANLSFIDEMSDWVLSATPKILPLKIAILLSMKAGRLYEW